MTDSQQTEIARLTDAERDDFRANLRQNLGYRAWVIEDTMLGHVERILTARAAVMLDDLLGFFDLPDDPENQDLIASVRHMVYRPAQT